MHLGKILASFITVIITVSSSSSERAERQSPSATVRHNPCSSKVQTNNPWPGGIIPYQISQSVPDHMRSAIHLAMKTVENMTCAQFLPRTTQPDYVHIEYGERCCSHSGKVGSGRQLLYVSEICINSNESLSETVHKLAGIITHEASNDNCGGSYIIVPGSSPGKIMSSTAVNHHYLPNSNCLWRLWLPSDKILHVSFTLLELEGGEGCHFDYIHLFQENATGHILNSSKLCGIHSSLYQLNTLSNTSVLSVHFKSDSSQQMRGFVMHYRLVNDSIQCSVENGGCSQTCLADAQGNRIGCSCRKGYEINGTLCNDINECSDRKICQQQCKNTPGSYYCHCKKGYAINDDMKTCRVCKTRLNSTSGVISSPNYPMGYPPQLNCLWIVSIWAGHYLNVTITNLSLPTDAECSKNFLRPNHGRFSRSRRICGHYSVIQYIARRTGSNVSFQLYTGMASASDDAGGFLLSYHQVPISSVSRSELESVNINGAVISYKSQHWT